MLFSGDNKYLTFLENENRELKEQVQKLTDAILTLKGGIPAFQKREPATPKVRLSMDALRRRLEASERIS